MERFKVENFEREHPGQSFPHFVTLEPNEAERIRRAIISKSRADPKLGERNLLAHLTDIAIPLEHVNAESDEFDLAMTLKMLGINPNHEVYINWDTFRTIDRMAIVDLSKYFDDIWYPAAEDIDIFDDTLSWILLVRHYGGVELARLNDSQ